MPHLLQRVDAECPHCRTLHANVPIDGDEDGNRYPDLDTNQCNDDTCTKDLCASCPQFTCVVCDGHFCLEPSHIGEEIEPECTCVFSGDRADSSRCEEHGPRRYRTQYLCRVCAQQEQAEVIEMPVRPAPTPFPQEAA